MADSSNDSTPVEEKTKESEMDSSADEKVEDMESKEPEETTENGEQKNDAEDEEKDDESDEEEEELPPGLLEQPLEVQGKREKKKVERLSAAMVPQSSEKKKVEIEDGSGVKLGDIAFIENKLNSTKAIDLKPLHRLLFLRIGAANEVKKNIRQFCGFKQSKESKEYERRTTMLAKMHIPELKSICQILGLERSGAKKDVVDRIMEFLMTPDDKGMKVPKSKKAKRTSKSADKESNKGKKRKRTPKKKTKKAKSDEEVEDEDAGSLEDDDDDEDEKEVSEPEEESEDEAPKKKKAKTEPKKKSSEKVNGKKEKAPPKKETKKPPPKKKKDSISEDDLSDASDSDDEPIANIKKSPPSNDEIKELVKKILDGADLESVTMKTVVKEVYSKYPTFDLSDRKDFIKSTVREVIS